MKRTAFFDIHQNLGAKIVEFGGFEMPVHYTSILDEHQAVRRGVGLFDVSHMGEFEVRGSEALAFVQHITINDASKLTDGKAQYSAMCYGDGGIVDDLLVYRLASDRFMLVVNAANISKDFEWISCNRGQHRVEIIDISDSTSLLALQGPKSIDTLSRLTSEDLGTIPYYSFRRMTIAGVEMLVSRTGYTGEMGFELYFDSSQTAAKTIWNSIMEVGKEYGVKPIGLGARDTLRLEMGYCLYGNDIDETTNPLEAGLAWITKLEKEDFVGRDVLLRVKQDGLRRRLIGFVVDEERAFPRHGYEIRVNGSSSGSVTSGSISPILEKGIGLGYVSSSASEPGTRIRIVIRGKEVDAHVVKVPFIKKSL